MKTLQCESGFSMVHIEGLACGLRPEFPGGGLPI